MLEQEAILREVTKFLRVRLTKMPIPERSIRTMIDDVAPPNSGDEFIAVRCTEISNEYPAYFSSFKIIYGLTITIVKRCSGVPNELAGEALLTDQIYRAVRPSLEARADEIVKLIHGSWELMNLINTSVSDNEAGGFATPFGFISKDAEPRKVDADQFDLEEDSNDLRYSALVTDVVFGGAEYYSLCGPLI